MKAYRPLFLVVLLSVLLPVVIDTNLQAGIWMEKSMGFFLVLLAMLKLFDTEAFARGFAKYDRVAQRFPLYGRLYPVLECVLGLLYLSPFVGTSVYILTIAVMGTASISVLLALAKHERHTCACMGNILQVPLSTVSAVENIGMVLMAAAMLMTSSQ